MGWCLEITSKRPKPRPYYNYELTLFSTSDLPMVKLCVYNLHKSDTKMSNALVFDSFDFILLVTGGTLLSNINLWSWSASEICCNLKKAEATSCVIMLRGAPFDFQGGHGSWGRVNFFLVSPVGQVFLLQKLPSPHRISGWVEFFFFAAFGSKVFFFYSSG